MKLAVAIYLLGRVLRRQGLQQGKLFDAVNKVDERGIYTEMARRWMVWTGKRWIKVKRIRG